MLTVIAPAKLVAESGQHIVELNRSDCEGLAYRNIETTSDDKVPSLIIGSSCGVATKLTSRNQVSVHVGMGSAKHRFSEGLEVLTAVFENELRIIREHTPVSRNVTARWAKTDEAGRECERLCEIGIAVHLALNPKQVVDPNDDAACPAVQRKWTHDAIVIGRETHVGITDGDFHVRIILSKRRHAEQQRYAKMIAHFSFILPP